MDWNAVGSNAIFALVPVGTLIAVFYARVFFPRIPRVLLPLVAALLPALLTMLSNYLASADLPPLLMALLGALATWLREVYNTFDEHGLRS